MRSPNRRNTRANIQKAKDDIQAMIQDAIASVDDVYGAGLAIKEKYGIARAAESVKEIDEPRLEKVFRNGPVTGVIWSDKSKTMTRLSDGDACNTSLALLNCYWRKKEHNRGKSDRHYDESRILVNWLNLSGPDEMREVARQLEFLADAHDYMKTHVREAHCSLGYVPSERELIEAKREKKNK